MPAGWDPQESDYPLAPTNGIVTSPFQPGVHDIRWDNPALLSGNTPYHVVGVNIYRSDASDRGPFVRLNDFPVGSTFFRDRTDYALIDRERVDWDTSWVFRGDKPNDRQFKFRTRNRIVKREAQAPFQGPTFADSPKDVTVWIDGVEVAVDDVFGRSGEVTLINDASFNVITEKNDNAILPTADSVVEISYWTPRNHVPHGLETTIWYRLTTVVLDSTTPSGYNETPLGQSAPISLVEVESLDYIWREGVRRNAWILQQGGERVKLFVRKVNGVPCDCTRDHRTLEYAKQPENMCLTCYGTGIIGGYDGPYDIIIAPDDGERRVSQTMYGRRREHTYEVFMGPTPLVTQRDFIVKQTNERYSVGSVRRPSNRGNLLQQHFQLGALDEGDIRFRVPIDGTTDLAWPETRSAEAYMPRTPVDGGKSYENVEGWENPGGAFPEGTGNQTTPMATDKGSTPDHVEKRGRTRVWENQNS